MSEYSFIRQVVLVASLATAFTPNDAKSIESNPYASGCLRHELGEDYARRICNSDDADDTFCLSSSHFDYEEIRVHNGDWESSIFYAWIIQILLSERIEVPSTIESVGTAKGAASFYHPDSVLPYSGKAYIYDAVELAHDIGDCRTNGDDGEPCAHVLPEVWSSQQRFWEEARDEGYIDDVAGDGQVGKIGWYVPRSLADRDPTLVSHYGMQGKENRKKLAATYGRPTTWLEWCRDISNSSCGTAQGGTNDGIGTWDDGVAVRWPKNGTSEETSYFSEGLFKGHFRFTEENNCTLNPDTCTGHIVDPPCSWGSYTESQTYWNGIALKSNGPEGSKRGYSYGSMIEIWRAANATNSNVIMWWWRPDNTIQEFAGTPYEFQPVVLHTPTEECVQSRVTDFCSPDLAVRRGEKGGSCDYEANAPRKVIAASLKTNAQSIPSAKRSPGYDLVKALQISDLAMESMFSHWLEFDQRDGASAREVVCKWVANNIEALDRQFIPRGYPRKVTKGSYENGFLRAMQALGVLVAVIAVLAGVVTYKWRDTRVMRYSQINFLLLLLIGFLFISTGAIVTTLEPSKASCITTPWLVMLGYGLAIVPLLVKIAAINKLMSAARRMKRVNLSKTQLFGAVALVMTMFAVYLILWTTIDPPLPDEDWVLVNEGESTVEVSLLCASSSNVWRYLASGLVFLLLLAATVLAWQNRNVRQEFNESSSLAVVTYSHFIFAVLALVTFMLPSTSISAYTRAGITSLLLSLDTLISLCIYFFPKFVSAYYNRGETQSWQDFNNASAEACSDDARVKKLQSEVRSLRATIGGMRQTMLETASTAQVYQHSGSTFQSSVPPADGEDLSLKANTPPDDDGSFAEAPSANKSGSVAFSGDEDLPLKANTPPDDDGSFAEAPSANKSGSVAFSGDEDLLTESSAPRFGDEDFLRFPGCDTGV